MDRSGCSSAAGCCSMYERDGARGVRLALTAGLTAVFASLAPATASAQQQPDADRAAARAATQARLDSLIPVMMAAGRRANDFNQSQRDAERALVVAGTDTIRV